MNILYILHTATFGETTFDKSIVGVIFEESTFGESVFEATIGEIKPTFGEEALLGAKHQDSR